MREKLNYNAINWNDFFYLAEDSPSGLRRTTNKAVAGVRTYKTTGEPRGWDVKLKSVTYKVHRVMWVMTTGSINLDLVIDHKDGDPFNNSSTNMELTTTKGNSQNRKKHTNNSSGKTGVYYKTRRQLGKIYYSWAAIWRDAQGVCFTKIFSCTKFGYDKAYLLACEHRDEQIRKLITEGSNYSARHGL